MSGSAPFGWDNAETTMDENGTQMTQIATDLHRFFLCVSASLRELFRIMFHHKRTYG